MNNNIMISAKNIGVMYHLNTEKVDNIKEYIVRLFKKNMTYKEFWALRDISFELKRGDSLGIIGLNGSGKSTLLKIIAGILKPSEGSVEVRGKVAPLIELGAGFDPDLSAKENIYLNGAILGFSRKHMEKKFDSIINFSELQSFVDVPIKNFSSGMTARLGFAIATMEQPDILILDEVLSVGDYKFQEKSFARTQEIIEKGATVLFVSHSMESVLRLCNKSLWLEEGRMKAFGPTEEISRQYEP